MSPETQELDCTACGQTIAVDAGSHDPDVFRCDDCVERGQVAHCPCGRSFSRPEWTALKLIGLQALITEKGTEDQGRALELRNCTCGSTRTIVVAKPTPAGNPHLKKSPRARKPQRAAEKSTFVLDFDSQCNRVQLHGLITRAGREATEAALWDLWHGLKAALKEDGSALVAILQADEYKLWVRRADSSRMSGAEEGEAIDAIRAAVKSMGFRFA
jgi:hypothetical protein